MACLLNISTIIVQSNLESRNPWLTYVNQVWAVPRSLAATDGITVLFSFTPGTKMFQFPDLPLSTLFYSGRSYRAFTLGRVAPFGHPRISACNGSSWLFAVYCVLHRLLAPRYPPCALCSLTKCSRSVHSGSPFYETESGSVVWLSPN